MSIAWSLFRLAGTDVPGLPSPKVSYAEYTAILLTGLTIVLAVLGVTIAVVAIWGYKGIEEKVVSTTKKATARYLNSAGGQALLTKVTEPHVQERVKAAVENMSLSQAYPVNGSSTELTGTQRLADEYHDVEEVKNDSLNSSSESD